MLLKALLLIADRSCSCRLAGRDAIADLDRFRLVEGQRLVAALELEWEGGCGGLQAEGLVHNLQAEEKSHHM